LRSAIPSVLGLLLAVSTLPVPRAHASWVEFADESTARLVGAPELGITDQSEKAYAVGDVDRDGDPDLAVARREGWGTLGKRPNVLFINENGVLTDRTAEFASASAEPGDLGFLTPTNDRHLILVDVDLDGWLDVVTATTLSPGDPKPVGHPRVYRNLGCTGACRGTADWLGFFYEPDRIPAMLSASFDPGFNPCFNHVDAGDVDGDSHPDLWFLDSDTPTNVCKSSGADFNSKLLLNLGAADPGRFVDVTQDSLYLDIFAITNFAASGWIEDVDEDGLADLIKQSSGTVDVGYNASIDPFKTTSTPYDSSAYFASTGDLNHDGRSDLIISDDGQDGYLLNEGVSPQGTADFGTFAFTYAHDGLGGPALDDGFGGNNYVADLDRDGWNDVLIADVDPEVQGCARRMHVFRNLGGVPGGEVSLQEQTTGKRCDPSYEYPPDCLVASIPSDRLKGVHDVAAFDVNGDGWQDLVVGRCSGTQVWINQPPGPPAGAIDVAAAPGQALRIAKDGAAFVLTWGASCMLGDTDFAIYHGSLDAPGQHAPLTCSTEGATSYAGPLPDGSAYFLVAPHNGIVEGSLGTAGSGAERPPGFPACLPRFIAECP
jgi:hypothetical protein